MLCFSNMTCQLYYVVLCMQQRCPSENVNLPLRIMSLRNIFLLSRTNSSTNIKFSLLLFFNRGDQPCRDVGKIHLIIYTLIEVVQV